MTARGCARDSREEHGLALHLQAACSGASKKRRDDHAHVHLRETGWERSRTPWVLQGMQLHKPYTSGIAKFAVKPARSGSPECASPTVVWFDFEVWPVAQRRAERLSANHPSAGACGESRLPAPVDTGTCKVAGRSSTQSSPPGMTKFTGH